MKVFLAGTLVAMGLLGCTNRDTYDSLQGAREQECRQIADASERDQCFDNARTSYDKFEQRRNESRNN